MSETPPIEPSSTAEETTDVVGDTSPAPNVTTSHSRAPQPSKFSRWASLAALVIAVIAVAAAVLGWFYPHKSASSAPTYTDQQQKDAKKHICETFHIVDHAAVRSSHLKNPDNGGPIGGLSVLTAKNFAYYSSGAFLRDRLNLEPATPSELAKPANELATDLEELGIGSLAGAKEFGQEELLRGLDDKIKAIGEICKK